MADDGLIQPNAAVEAYTERAREAHANLRKHWDSWIQIGRSIYAFNLQLDEAIIPNEGRPEDSQRWRDSMGAYLRREGWHELQSTGFSKSERINLLRIMSRLDEIEAYRMRFGEVKGQQKLTRHNNPNQVWRSFLKDIGELQVKEGGKKSTLSESVAELSEENDALREENAHLKDEFAGDDWEEKLKAIVIKNDAEALASAIWDADAETTTPAINLTEAMINEYQKVGSILEVVDLDRREVIRHNSQKARRLADAILNQLDGQTDEPNDERLARRIVNARGTAAAQSLAQAIVALIQKRSDPEPVIDQGYLDLGEPPPHPPGEPVELPKLPDPILGLVVVLGGHSRSTNTPLLPKDHPEAGWWYLYRGRSSGDGVVWSFLKAYEGGFGALGDAERAAAVYNAALAVEPEKKKRGPQPKPKLDEFGRPARPEIGDKHIRAHTSATGSATDAKDTRCDAKSSEAVEWYLEYFAEAVDKRKRGEWQVMRRSTSLADALAYKDGEAAEPLAVAPGEEPAETVGDVAEHASNENRLGQKRIVGKSNGSYVPVDMVDYPFGEVERYFLEVFQPNDTNPEGVCGSGSAARVGRRPTMRPNSSDLRERSINIPVMRHRESIDRSLTESSNHKKRGEPLGGVVAFVEIKVSRGHG